MTLQAKQNRRPFAKVTSFLFALACSACMLISVLMLVVLLWQVIVYGQEWLRWDFITHYASRFPKKAGILAALVGSLYLVGMTALFAIPIGVGTAVYLEEYAKKNRWRALIQLNIANLAGVPSIVYGILGLGLFVQMLHFGRGILAGAATLTLVILPIIIITSQEALRAVPSTIREASYALGASRWQTVWRQLLPAALPGILTGVILSLSRALGEAAPLVAIGAATYVRFTPESVFDKFTALPLQIYNWTGDAKADFHHLAAAAIIVLLVVLISMNAIAIFLRARFSKHIRW